MLHSVYIIVILFLLGVLIYWIINPNILIPQILSYGVLIICCIFIASPCSIVRVMLYGEQCKVLLLPLHPAHHSLYGVARGSIYICNYGTGTLKLYHFFHFYLNYLLCTSQGACYGAKNQDNIASCIRYYVLY